MMQTPEQLTTRPRWVCHDAAKQPRQPTTGRLASSTDPATWTDYATACANAYRFAGLGFVLGDGVTGIDLDDCRDAGSGLVDAWAWQIVCELDSFTELSPSGTGLHVYCLGTWPEHAGHKRPMGEGRRAVEVYDRDRYFCVTGNHLTGTPSEVLPRQAALDALAERLWPQAQQAPDRTPAPVQLALTDLELLEAAFRARNGQRTAELFQEAGAAGNSEGDAALAARLAFYSGGDPARLERLMLASSRWRAKWDSRRGAGTWLQAECREAIARHRGDFYQPRRREASGRAVPA